MRGHLRVVATVAGIMNLVDVQPVSHSICFLCWQADLVLSKYRADSICIGNLSALLCSCCIKLMNKQPEAWPALHGEAGKNRGAGLCAGLLVPMIVSTFRWTNLHS